MANLNEQVRVRDKNGFTIQTWREVLERFTPDGRDLLLALERRGFVLYPRKDGVRAVCDGFFFFVPTKDSRRNPCIYSKNGWRVNMINLGVTPRTIMSSWQRGKCLAKHIIEKSNWSEEVIFAKNNNQLNEAMYNGQQRN